MADLQIPIIDESLPILIRESLDDTGTHDCVNHSPDIVVQKFKLDNPVADLRASYNSDISKDGDGSGKMYLYVRFKNISKQPLDGFYIHLYRNHLGLCNIPRDWASYEMKTEDGNPVYIKFLGPGEIGATSAFIYDNSQRGSHPNCFVAVATREKNPDYSSVNTYDKYVRWINKPNVAARNVCVKPRSTHRQEELFYFQTPYKDSPAMVGFYVQLSDGSTQGIRYGIVEKKLGIDESKTYIPDVTGSDYIFKAVRLSPGYAGTLLGWYETLGSDSASIDITFWDLNQKLPSSLLDQYGIDLGERLANITEMEQTALKPMRAIMLGGCHLRSKT